MSDAIPSADGRQASKQELQFMFDRLRQLVRVHPVAAFYALAFPLSWRAYLIALFHPGGELGLDPYGPLVAAVVVMALAGGFGGLKDWARTLLRWRAAPSLYAFALLVPLAITLLGIGTNVALGAKPPPAATWTSWPWLLVVFPLVMVLGGPLGEEPAWRGLALARVAERRPMLQASLAVGVVWFTWHLPLLLARPGEVAPGLVGILSASVVFGWLYQRSNGAVVLPLLMHTGFYAAIALVLVLRDRRLRAAPIVEEPQLPAPRIAA
jgi:membrane protease YdiL (CAAX protease family)